MMNIKKYRATTTREALEKIKKAVQHLEVTEGSTNARLKAEILDAAKKGLITHV